MNRLIRQCSNTPYRRTSLMGVLLFLLCCPSMQVSATQADQLSPSWQLRRADQIKTSNHAQFVPMLDSLASRAETLPDSARWYLRYLQAWEESYAGHYTRATTQLNLIVRDCPIRELRFRARVTLMNIDAVSLQYDRAFQRLVKLSSEVDTIDNREALIQYYSTTAILYNKVGEYGLASAAANHLMTPGNPANAQCKGRYFALLARYHDGQLNSTDSAIQKAQQTCTDSGEGLLTNSLRILVAKLELANGSPAAAVATLSPHFSSVLQTGYAELIMDYSAEMAQAYLQAGKPEQAAKYARRVVDTAGTQEFSESLASACKTLYLISKARGDTDAALSWYERYAEADKGYLNEVSAKSLAYQQVKQRVAASHAQAEAARKQNRILQLQQSLSQKVAETRGLYAVLLLLLLLALSTWIWRLLRAQRQLRTLAEHDSLTGIFNRQHFVNAAQALLRNARRESHELSLILLDLDHFKLVNDTHGHAAGDAVLKRTVLACQRQIRPSDLFGRLGGEEFGIMLPDCGLTAATGHAERIRSAIASLSSASHDTPRVTASVGVASTAKAGYDLRQLMIHADDALYRAKRNGRNQVAVSDGGISMVRTDFSESA